MLALSWALTPLTTYAQQTASPRPASRQYENEVQFSFYHREYGYKTLEQGPGKPQRRVMYMKDGYPVIYALSADLLTIYKAVGKPRRVVVVKKLNKEQASIFNNVLAKTDFESLADSSAIDGVDDGFQVEVTIHKSGKSISLFWSNAYVKPLVELFDIVNNLSPEEFRVYNPRDKKQFIEQLQGTSH